MVNTVSGIAARLTKKNTSSTAFLSLVRMQNKLKKISEECNTLPEHTLLAGLVKDRFVPGLMSFVNGER